MTEKSEIAAACAKSVPESSTQVGGSWSELFFAYAEPTAAIFSAFTALGAIGIAVLVHMSAKKHMKEERRSWGVQRFTYLHEFLSSDRYAKARYRLRKARKDKEAYNAKEHDDPMDAVCASYDQAGLILLNPDYILESDKEKFLESSWGHSIIEQYETVREYELKRDARKSQKTPYPYSTQLFFKQFRALYDETCSVRRHQRMQRW